MITTQLPLHVSRADAAPVFFLGLPTQFKATTESTGGAFGLVEHLSMPPGFASPYHTHRREDEAFYVLEGRVDFICDGAWTSAGPGTYVFGPRGLAHGFTVVGDAPARMMLLCAPGGFERFIAELSAPAPAPPDLARLMAVAAEYEIEIHGPLPARSAE
ncbi:MAG: cupin domain-containing protein [Vicinamibacterales bacterium]